MKHHRLAERRLPYRGVRTRREGLNVYRSKVLSGFGDAGAALAYPGGDVGDGLVVYNMLKPDGRAPTAWPAAQGRAEDIGVLAHVEGAAGLDPGGTGGLAWAPQQQSRQTVMVGRPDAPGGCFGGGLRVRADSSGASVWGARSAPRGLTQQTQTVESDDDG